MTAWAAQNSVVVVSGGARSASYEQSYVDAMVTGSAWRLLTPRR